jgi:tetratricopeptide (TPR) repeat protein
MGLMRHALTIALEHDKPSAALRAYNNLVDLCDYEDRYAEADRMGDEGLTLSRRVGNWFWESTFLGQGYPKFALGRWRDLMASLGEIPPDEFARSRSAFNQGYVSFGTAVEVHRGDLAAALRRLERFADLQTSADVQEVTEYACGAATLRLAEGDPKEALRLAEMALEGREALGLSHSCVKEGVVTGLEAALVLGDKTKVDEILTIVRTDPIGRRTTFFRAHASRIEARSADASDEGAERRFRSAIESFREIGFPFWLAVSLLEYGEWLEAGGRAPDVAPVVLEARSIFEGLAAKPWVDRAERVGQASAVTS